MVKRRRTRKKASEHNVYKWITAVVAVIAVVGLVSMFLGGGFTGLMAEPATHWLNIDTGEVEKAPEGGGCYPADNDFANLQISVAQLLKDIEDARANMAAW